MAHTENYFAEKYGLTPPHSELRALLPLLTAGSALDVGCGRGRNSLFLADHGFSVEAYDINPASVAFLQNTAAAEALPVRAEVRDFNQNPALSGNHDLVLSTVVMMFLQPATVPALIAQMQNATRSGGYNLIVSAMSTDDAPCPVDFAFTFGSGELLRHYQGWRIEKYNEDFGHLHRTDAQGNRIRLRFATLWAQKP